MRVAGCTPPIDLASVDLQGWSSPSAGGRYQQAMVVLFGNRGTDIGRSRWADRRPVGSACDRGHRRRLARCAAVRRRSRAGAGVGDRGQPTDRERASISHEQNLNTRGRSTIDKPASTVSRSRNTSARKASVDRALASSSRRSRRTAQRLAVSPAPRWGIGRSGGVDLGCPCGAGSPTVARTEPRRPLASRLVARRRATVCSSRFRVPR